MNICGEFKSFQGFKHISAHRMIQNEKSKAKSLSKMDILITVS